MSTSIPAADAMSTDTNKTEGNFEDYIRQPERFGVSDDNKEYRGSFEEDIGPTNDEDKNFEDGIRNPGMWRSNEDDKGKEEESNATNPIGDGENFDDRSRMPREFGDRCSNGLDDRIIFPDDDVYIAFNKEKHRKESDEAISKRQSDDRIIFPND